MEKSIYDLKLHETTEIKYSTIQSLRILRVAGGWIYGNTFVPFNNEFQTTKKQLEFDEFKETIKFNFKKSLIELGVSEQIASDWLKVRAKKKAANTKTAFNAIANQIKLTTHKPDDCIKMAVKRNWSGFEAEWYFNAIGKQNINPSNSTKFKELTYEEKQRLQINVNRTYIWSKIDGAEYAGLMTDEEKKNNGFDVNKIYTIQGREVK